ncbi:MAG TPA: malate synthase, partial [Clostridiales bacterium]|nr:malate synthase [Clostridiales bacterium]
MNVLNINVIHKAFGKGTVIEFDNTYITVQFADKSRKFEYP